VTRFALAAALLFASGVAAAQPAQVIARRGALTLTESGLRDLLDREPAEQRDLLLRDPAALSQFVRGRMLRLALQDEAKSQRFDVRPEIAARAEQARIEAITEAFLESLGRPDAAFPSEAEIRAVYDANQARFMVPRQYRLTQIFLAVPQGAAKPLEDEALRKLREWRMQATQPRNRADFADLARRFSEDRNNPNRGTIDWTREDRLIEPVREAVGGLEEGAISDPIRTTEGFHLVRVDGTRPAAPAPLEDVRAQIVTALRQQRTQELTRAALNEMLRREPIQIDEIQLGRLATQTAPAPATVATPAPAAAAPPARPGTTVR